MKTIPLFAGLAGALAGLLLAAVPLWRQQVRHAADPQRTSATQPAMESLLEKVAAARQRGGKADAELRAAEVVESFTADQCRDAVDHALASGNKELLRDLLSRWAALDGAAVLAWMKQHEDAIGLGMIEDVYSTWASSDPAGCAFAIEEGAVEITHNHALLALPCVKYLMQFDLRAAVRVGSTICKQSPVGMIISRNDLRPAIRTTADAEAVGAEILAHPEWLGGLAPEKPLYLLVALRECWQEIDPDGWDRWAAAHPEAAANSDNQPLHPGIKFLRSPDRAAAARQILESTPPEKLAQTSEGVMKLWVDDDMEAAGEWLNTCPDGPVKNAATEAYALHAVSEDPAGALHWANAISDPVARARTQRRVFTAWHDAHPAAAAAWLPQSGWSEAQTAAARDIMAVRPLSGH